MVSLQKSFIVFSKNIPPRFVKILKRALGAEVKNSVGTYLGCPMEVNGRSAAIYKELEQKIKKKN